MRAAWTCEWEEFGAGGQELLMESEGGEPAPWGTQSCFGNLTH